MQMNSMEKIGKTDGEWSHTEVDGGVWWHREKRWCIFDEKNRNFRLSEVAFDSQICGTGYAYVRKNNETELISWCCQTKSVLEIKSLATVEMGKKRWVPTGITNNIFEWCLNQTFIAREYKMYFRCKTLSKSTLSALWFECWF